MPAEDIVQHVVLAQNSMRIVVALGDAREAAIVVVDETWQECVRLFDGADSGQSQLLDETILEGVARGDLHALEELGADCNPLIREADILELTADGVGGVVAGHVDEHRTLKDTRTGSRIGFHGVASGGCARSDRSSRIPIESEERHTGTRAAASARFSGGDHGSDRDERGYGEKRQTSGRHPISS